MQTITFEGNLTADPELRFTASGKPVLTLAVAVNARRKDENDQWVDGTATFWDKITVWGLQAETAAESFEKGNTVVVTDARIETEEWKDKDGNKRRTLALVIDDRQGYVTPSLRFAVARPAKVTRTSAETTKD